MANRGQSSRREKPPSALVRPKCAIHYRFLGNQPLALRSMRCCSWQRCKPMDRNDPKHTYRCPNGGEMLNAPLASTLSANCGSKWSATLINLLISWLIPPQLPTPPSAPRLEKLLPNVQTPGNGKYSVNGI